MIETDPLKRREMKYDKNLAHSLCVLWWKERKISYNFHPDKDEEFLAFVIHYKKFPEDIDEVQDFMESIRWY